MHLDEVDSEVSILLVIMREIANVSKPQEKDIARGSRGVTANRSGEANY